MSHTTPSGGYVLISGASTGIGRAAAIYLAKIGFQVLAGVRKEADGADIEQEARNAGAAGGVRAVRLDVTDGGTIASAAEVAREAAGDDGLAGIVNNAGVSFHGPVEHVPLDDWRRQFEVNLFGHVAVTQAMLPLLRQHVKARGRGRARVVNISSIGGRIAQPIISPYNASKYALEAVSDALRLELRPQGIKVCLVEPGAIDTLIWGKAEARGEAFPPDHPARALYGSMIDAITAAAKKAAAGAIPAEAAAEVIAACLTRRNPRARYLLGRDARAAAWAKAVLPTRVLDAGLGWALGIPR